MKPSLKLGARILLAALVTLFALFLRALAAPVKPTHGVPDWRLRQHLVMPWDTQPPRQNDYPATWREVVVKPAPAGLRLTVSPLVGIAPLAVTITLRLPRPQEHDRELELTAWDAGDAEMVYPLFRSTRDIYWREVRLLRQALQIAPGQPDTFESVPQTLRAHWRLPAGSVLVVGCVWPRSACVSQRVEVS